MEPFIPHTTRLMIMEGIADAEILQGRSRKKIHTEMMKKLREERKDLCKAQSKLLEQKISSRSINEKAAADAEIIQTVLSETPIEYGKSQITSKSLTGGVSIECGWQDLFWIVGEEDISKLLVKNSFRHNQNPTFYTGLQLGISPLFQINAGMENYSPEVLDNSAGTMRSQTVNSSEIHWGITAGYRNIRFFRFLNRVSSSKEFSNDRRNFEILYSFGCVKHDNLEADVKIYTHQISGGIELGKKRN